MPTVSKPVSGTIAWLREQACACEAAARLCSEPFGGRDDAENALEDADKYAHAASALEADAARVAELEQENERLRECAKAAVWAELAIKGDLGTARFSLTVERERVAELAALASARLRALEWLRERTSITVFPDAQDRAEFYGYLSAAVGAEVGPEEGDAQ